MNIFERFSLSREIIMREGEIILDQQKMQILPVNFIAAYQLRLKDSPGKLLELYESMKNGMIKYSKPLGKEYSFSYRNFLDRWVKYTTFGGWGIAEYKLIEETSNYGFLHIKNSPLHLNLKAKGITEPFDVFLKGIIAGALSGTFKADIDVIETKCVCAGNDVCIYYWGTKEYLQKKFPEIVSKQLTRDQK